MPESCVLCRILSGRMKPDRLCETETLVAVLNKWEPLSRGHALIFPRRHVASLHEMSVAELSEVLPVVRRLVAALKVSDYNVIQNNGALAHQTVPHAHFHFIPKWSEAEGLALTWNIIRDLDQSEVYARMIAHLDDDATQADRELRNISIPRGRDGSDLLNDDAPNARNTRTGRATVVRHLCFPQPPRKHQARPCD